MRTRFEFGLGIISVWFVLGLVAKAPCSIGEGREQPIRTYNQGIPIYSYGSTWILGEPPELLPGTKLQAGNTNPIGKLKLKKSWEIGENWMGGEPPRLPRTELMDKYQAPLLPINLIDEDTETYWCSRGQPVPNMEPVWIRLDLPVETYVKAVNLKLRTRPNRMSWQIGSPPGVVPAGKGVPQELEIKVAQDALTWHTVYSSKQVKITDDQRSMDFPFEPRPVKQIWIVGNQCPPVDCWGFCFSIADVEVIDSTGRNVASAKNGTGVTVSSTAATYDDNRENLDNLWGTIYDLGLKWMRLDGWDSVLQWSYVEREKGKYYIDPKADAAITELAKNKVHTMLTLAYGNYLYSPNFPDGKRQWAKESTDIMELAGPPLTPEAHQAFLNWTRFMVRHFKDRVEYYYLWNEPYQSPPYGWAVNGPGDAKAYAKWVRDVVKVVKEEYPEAKIAWPTAYTKGEFLEGAFKEGLAPLFDIVHADLSDPPGIKKRWRDAGFKGDRWITYEWSSLATYPTPSKAAPYTAPDAMVSELQKAKRVAGSAVQQASHQIVMGICEWFNTYHPIWDVGLFRNTFSADPISPMQPQPSYYVLRNMGTILAETKPGKFAYSIENTTQSFQLCQFAKSGHPMFVIYTAGQTGKKYADITLDTGFVMSIGAEQAATVDRAPDVKVDLRFPGANPSKVTGIDSINGLTQDLVFEADGNGVVVRGVFVKDYPLCIELIP